MGWGGNGLFRRARPLSDLRASNQALPDVCRLARMERSGIIKACYG